LIVEAFIDLADTLVTWFFSLFPSDFELPEWLLTLSTLLGEVLAGAAGMAVWIPWGWIMTVLTGTFTIWSVGFILKFARWVVGLLPTMGGG
jgi:hypothetical protein